MTLTKTEEMSRRERLREERRYRAVPISAEMVPHLVMSHRAGAGERLVIRGLPEDAVGVGASWDAWGNRLLVFVGHEDFAPVRPENEPPLLDVVCEIVEDADG